MKRLQKMICFIFGHKDILMAETDNGRSKFGTHYCQRCDREKYWQWDRPE